MPHHSWKTLLKSTSWQHQKSSEMDTLLRITLLCKPKKFQAMEKAKTFISSTGALVVITVEGVSSPSFHPSTITFCSEADPDDTNRPCLVGVLQFFGPSLCRSTIFPNFWKQECLDSKCWWSLNKLQNDLRALSCQLFSGAMWLRGGWNDSSGSMEGASAFCCSQLRL